MKRLLPVYLAAGASLGVIIAYLIGGGASYKPLSVADPCEQRPLSVLAERGVFEGIALSAIDGAACELGVSREELATALADPTALDAFAEARGIDDEQVVEAVRSGLLRAVDDAEAEGLLNGLIAGLATSAIETVPVWVVLDVFGALPGDPTLAELIAALADVGVGAGDLGSFGLDQLGELGDQLGQLGDLQGSLPAVPDGLDLGALQALLEEELPGPLQDRAEELLPNLDLP